MFNTVVQASLMVLAHGTETFKFLLIIFVQLKRLWNCTNPCNWSLLREGRWSLQSEWNLSFLSHTNICIHHIVRVCICLSGYMLEPMTQPPTFWRALSHISSSWRPHCSLQPVTAHTQPRPRMSLSSCSWGMLLANALKWCSWESNVQYPLPKRVL